MVPQFGPDLHRSDTLSTVSPGPRIQGRQQLPVLAWKYSIVLQPPGAAAAAAAISITPVPAWRTSLTVTHEMRMKRWYDQGASTAERPPLAGCSQAGFGFSRERDSGLPEARTGTGASAVQPQLALPTSALSHHPSAPPYSHLHQATSQPLGDRIHPHPGLPPTAHGCLHMAFSSQSFWELGGLHGLPDSRTQPSRGSPRWTTDQHRAGRPDHLV